MRMSATAASSRPPPNAWPSERGDQGDPQTRERFERAMAGPSPNTPHLERPADRSSRDVPAGAERLALARQDRDPNVARGLDRSRGVAERVDHRRVEGVELLRPLKREQSKRTFKCQIDEGAHGAALHSRTKRQPE